MRDIHQRRLGPLSSTEASSDFYDPFSDLSLFLAQKIKEEIGEGGSENKWTLSLQERLIAKITPELQKKFPNYRLGVAALKNTWEKVSYYLEHLLSQKEALTSEGKLSLSFLIKENLRQHFFSKNNLEAYPHHFSRQLALKIGECLATIDGVKPALDHLSKTIWFLQKHLTPKSKLSKEPLPYDEMDLCDKLIIKTMLEILGKKSNLSQSQLQSEVAEAIKGLKELPNFSSVDQVTLTISALLAEKLFPQSQIHRLLTYEEKEEIQKFIKEHLVFFKQTNATQSLPETVRRVMAFYQLASHLPKDLAREEIETAISVNYSTEKPPLPQAIYAFLASRIRFSPDSLVAGYEQAKKLPQLTLENLELFCWKVLSEEEHLLDSIPYRIGQRIEEEIAHILIDNPEQNFSGVVSMATQFFRKAAELASSKKGGEIERKITLWTHQGELLCRFLKLESDNAILKLICHLWNERSIQTNHALFVNEVAQFYFRTHPDHTIYSPQVTARISILYKYAWYCLFDTEEESSVDRFSAWHAADLEHLEEEKALDLLENLYKSSLPLVPFDRKSSLQRLRLSKEQKRPQNSERHA